MKKMTKIFGTVAVSAALAIGTAMPAFAADPTAGSGLAGDATGDKQDHAVVNGVPGSADKESMSTDVLAYYDKNAAVGEDQVSAAVPLGIYIVINGTANDEKDIITPSNYYIKNTGKNTVEVTKVVGKMDSTSGKNWVVAETGTDLGTTGNNIKMLFKTGAKQIDLKKATEGTGYTDFGLTIAEDSSAGFEITGKTRLAAEITDQDELAEKVFDLTYTIKKAQA